MEGGAWASGIEHAVAPPASTSSRRGSIWSDSTVATFVCLASNAKFLFQSWITVRCATLHPKGLRNGPFWQWNASYQLCTLAVPTVKRTLWPCGSLPPSAVQSTLCSCEFMRLYDGLSVDGGPLQRHREQLGGVVACSPFCGPLVCLYSQFLSRTCALVCLATGRLCLWCHQTTDQGSGRHNPVFRVLHGNVRLQKKPFLQFPFYIAPIGANNILFW